MEGRGKKFYDGIQVLQLYQRLALKIKSVAQLNAIASAVDGEWMMTVEDFRAKQTGPVQKIIDRLLYENCMEQQRAHNNKGGER